MLVDDEPGAEGAGVALAVAAGVAVLVGAGVLGTGVPGTGVLETGAVVPIGAGDCMPGVLLDGSAGIAPPPDELPPPPQALSSGMSATNARTHEVLKFFITLLVVGLKLAGLKLLAGQAEERRGDAALMTVSA
jgi:hypothetical protein